MRQLYAEVIPLLRLPKNLGVFDYSVPPGLSTRLSPSDIVEIPYRKKNVLGAVKKIKTQPFSQKIAIQPIAGLVCKNFLCPYQLELALWMSEYYWQSPSLVLRAILPKISKRKLVQVSDSLKKIRFKNAINPGEKNILLFEIILPHSLRIFGKKILKEKKQILVLVPEISSMRHVGLFYKKIYPRARIAEFSSEISQAQILALWTGILQKKYDIILGTRSAVFAPLVSPGLIIVHSEDDASLKQWDQNPRYHARDVALKISELTGCPIFLLSPGPKVTTYARALKNFHILPPGDNGVEKIVDMREYGAKFNNSFSEYLLERLKNISGQAILLQNKKGFSSLAICKNCGYIPHCQKCLAPQATSDGDEKLFCRRCGNKISFPVHCPKCQYPIFSFLGHGTEKIYYEIKKIFPQISSAHFDGNLNKHESQQVIQDFLNKKTKMLVATQAIFNELPPEFVCDIIAVISADIFLFTPDYLASEKTFQLLRYSKIFSKECIIQTYTPSHYSLASITSHQWKNFYSRELLERRRFRYPPYSRIARIIIKSAYNEQAKKQSMQISEKLQYIVSKNSLPVEILGPLPSSRALVRGKYQWNIILKILKPGIDLTALQKLIPEDIIDIDPNALS